MCTSCCVTFWLSLVVSSSYCLRSISLSSAILLASSSSSCLLLASSCSFCRLRSSTWASITRWKVQLNLQRSQTTCETCLFCQQYVCSAPLYLLLQLFLPPPLSFFYLCRVQQSRHGPQVAKKTNKQTKCA